MPRCNLSQEFIALVIQSRPEKIIHYNDSDIPGFLLEYRPTRNGTWYFRYSDERSKLRYFRLGTLKNLSVQDARAQAYELYKFVREGGNPKTDMHATHKIPLFIEFVTLYYLPHAKLKKRSWETDVRMLELHILPQFGNRKMDRIRRIDVVTWQNQLREGELAPGTCNRILSLLRFVFSCAIRWAVLAVGQNPCQGVVPFDDNGARERYLSSEEARRLIAELDSHPKRQSALAIKLLLYTGARKSEVLSARWEHVDLERRLLTVPLSKSGKVRHIPLSDEAVNILGMLPRKENCAWLFWRAGTDKPLRTLFYTWNTIRNRLGIPEVRIHDLRHSFASFLVNSGCSLYEVQKILGHYDPKVTMRYAHLAQSSLVKAANMVEKSIKL